MISGILSNYSMLLQTQNFRLKVNGIESIDTINKIKLNLISLNKAKFLLFHAATGKVLLISSINILGNHLLLLLNSDVNIQCQA